MKKKNENKMTNTEFLDALKKAGGNVSVVYDKEEDKKEKKDKNKTSVDITKETQMLLDNLRREIVEFLSRNNDLEMMKKVEKCNYDRLIFLLNVGFEEKHFYDALCGKNKISIEDVSYTDESRNLLKQILEGGQNGK